MSKTGNFFFEMQEHAREMTLSEFVARYGHSYTTVWTDINLETHGEPDPEPYYYPGSDPQQ